MITDYIDLIELIRIQGEDFRYIIVVFVGFI